MKQEEIKRIFENSGYNAIFKYDDFEKAVISATQSIKEGAANLIATLKDLGITIDDKKEKYTKRVENRKKLYAKRKAKYGK